MLHRHHSMHEWCEENLKKITKKAVSSHHTETRPGKNGKKSREKIVWRRKRISVRSHLIPRFRVFRHCRRWNVFFFLPSSSLLSGCVYFFFTSLVVYVAALQFLHTSFTTHIRAVPCAAEYGAAPRCAVLCTVHMCKFLYDFVFSFVFCSFFFR